MLLSLLPPSYMVVFLREVANTLNPSTTKEIIVNTIVHNISNIDMNMNTPRRRSPLSSINYSRAASACLNTSSISYYKRMEIQSKKLSWDK